jgi:hypothetical protein
MKQSGQETIRTSKAKVEQVPLITRVLALLAKSGFNNRVVLGSIPEMPTTWLEAAGLQVEMAKTGSHLGKKIAAANNEVIGDGYTEK